jgi:hypothetical protein
MLFGTSNIHKILLSSLNPLPGLNVTRLICSTVVQALRAFLYLRYIPVARKPASTFEKLVEVSYKLKQMKLLFQAKSYFDVLE